MIDFTESRTSALKELKETYFVSALNAKEKKDVNLQSFDDVWSISTEIFLVNNLVLTVRLFIALPDDFPLVLPKIYLSSSDNERIKYIPHVNVSGFICLFDEESIIVDSSNACGIIKACLAKARSILEDGINKRNLDDFKSEFIAYWDEKYDEKDKIVTGLCMINADFNKAGNAINFLCLNQEFAGHSIIIYNNNSEVEQLKDFLIEHRYKIEDKQGFYLGEITELMPPFNYSNSKSFQIIIDHFPNLKDEYHRFINQMSYPTIVVFSMNIKGKDIFFGWQVASFNTQRNGFRNGSLSAMDFYTKFQKLDRVIRLKFDLFTRERLHNRSEGTEYQNTKARFTIAGLGSIGSNLLPYLLPLDVQELHLIDPDILTLENTKRHLLGLDYVRTYKANALRQTVELKNPLIKAYAYKASVIGLIKSRAIIFNDSDFNFLAIGKNNIEEFIFTSLSNYILTKPFFILWVEPYLCGGHCLYICPGHTLDFKDLFDKGFYRFNIIDSSEYLDPSRQLLFREAGCQNSFVPYGQKNITLFLAKLAPHIYSIIESMEKSNLRLTFRGNHKVQEALNLKVSDNGTRINDGEIKISEI